MSDSGVVRTKRKKFSETAVVGGFLDGLSGDTSINTNLIEDQSDKFKREFDRLTKGDQRKVLEFIEFLKSRKGKRKS